MNLSILLRNVLLCCLLNVGSKTEGDDRLKNFHDFKSFLRDHHDIDIFIDGANIAHYKQNHEGGCFCYQQIQLAADYLQQQGYKVLILLHENHFNQPESTLPEVRFMIDVDDRNG